MNLISIINSFSAYGVMTFVCVVFSHFHCNNRTNFLQTNRAIIMSMTRLSAAVVLLVMMMMMMMLLRQAHGQGKITQ